MKWCRCAKCGHKLFLYNEEKANEKNNLEINIKCSSCKRIMRVIVLNRRISTVIFGGDEKNAEAGRKVDKAEVKSSGIGGDVHGKE